MEKGREKGKGKEKDLRLHLLLILGQEERAKVERVKVALQQQLERAKVAGRLPEKEAKALEGKLVSV